LIDNIDPCKFTGKSVKSKFDNIGPWVECFQNCVGNEQTTQNISLCVNTNRKIYRQLEKTTETQFLFSSKKNYRKLKTDSCYYVLLSAVDLKQN
jgi:hypothetical protein